MRDLDNPPQRRRSRQRLGRLLPDLMLGAAAALGLAPFEIWTVTLIALAVLLARLSRCSPALAFQRGLAAGIGWFGLGLVWIVEPFLVEPEIYGWMAPFALILMAVGGALFWAIPVWLGSRLAPGPRRRILAIAAALILSDWLRGWIFTGFPWALIGHVWIDTPIAQSAAWIGAIGLSALTLTLAALPRLLTHNGSRWGIVPGTIIACLAGAAIWTAGLARLDQPLPPDRDLIVRIVQPNAEQHLKWDPEWSQVFFQRLIDLSAQPGRRDLVIWPETAVNFLLNDAAEITPYMAEAAGAPLLLGIQRREGERYLNSLAALDDRGDSIAIYDKFHLVPFGEYIPWGDTLARIGIGAFAAQNGNGYSAGPGPQLMSLPGLPAFQPLICYEAIFPQHLRTLKDRPEWLLQVTNDAWFGRFSGPHQHLAQARLRAIETGLPLIRAANTGTSAVIDPYGRLRDHLELGAAGKIDAALPGMLPPTVWTERGPLLIILPCLFILIVIAVHGLVRRYGGAAPRR